MRSDNLQLPHSRHGHHGYNCHGAHDDAGGHCGHGHGGRGGPGGPGGRDGTGRDDVFIMYRVKQYHLILTKYYQVPTIGASY